MAQLQAPGSPIAISTIRGLKSSGNKSLNTLETQYMNNLAGTNAIPETTGVCMPEDVINVTTVLGNLGVLAKNTTAANGFTQWAYQRTGGDPGTPTWGPHSMKEFYSAYTGVPTISLGKAATGRCNQFSLTVRINGEFSKNSTNYFICGSRSYGGTGSPCGGTAVLNGNWIGWPGGSAGPSVQAVWTVLRSSGTYTYYVRDYLNCGTHGGIAASLCYPSGDGTVWQGSPHPCGGAAACDPLGGNCSPSL